MSRHANSPRLGCVGAGRVASYLLPRFQNAGVDLSGLSSRTPSSARRLARRLGVPHHDEVATLIDESRWLLLAVPDDALEPLSKELAPLANWSGKTVLHFSGLHGPEVLRRLASRGAETGVLHPLAVIPKAFSHPLPTNSAARCEGSPKALRVARRLARNLDLRPLRVDRWTPSRRADYHTAATLAANDLVALLVSATKLLRPLGLSRRQALDALIPLAQGALQELQAQEPGDAVSGPIPRGDVGTVQCHLERLQRGAPALEGPHLVLAEQQLKLALESKRISPREAAALRKLFRGGR